MNNRPPARAGLPWFRGAIPLGLALLSLASPVRAQRNADPLAQLSASARTAVRAAADSLDAEGLPGDALVAKAAEGLLKGADDHRILVAVNRLASELRAAGAALGRDASESEVVAAANALHAGASPELLRRLRALAPAGQRDGRLTVPLVVITDLVSRGAPVHVAAESVISLLASHATDADLQALRAGVERDIIAGDDPATAAAARSRALTDSLGGGAMRPVRPPAPRISRP
jgi:hypothetical protein